MQGARRGGEGVLANEDPPPQPRENVPPPWAGGYNHLHFHPHFTSCCAIPGVWHSEGMTRTLTDHVTLCWVCHSVGLAYMAPKISSHLSLSSPSLPSSYSPYQARAQQGWVRTAPAMLPSKLCGANQQHDGDDSGIVMIRSLMMVLATMTVMAVRMNTEH